MKVSIVKHFAVALRRNVQLAATGMQEKTVVKVHAIVNGTKKTIVIWLAGTERIEGYLTDHSPDEAPVAYSIDES